MTTFERAVEFVLAYEKEWSDDPSDPGNWTGGKAGTGELKGTKWGISAGAFPHLDIKNLSQPDCVSIYRSEYWEPCKCQFLPSPLGVLVMDSAVNQGQGTAIRVLQKSLGVNADGIIGTATLIAIGKASLRPLIAEFVAQRAFRYSQAPNFDSNALGWFRRLMACYSAALEPL